jgi:hypothetical protein
VKNLQKELKKLAENWNASGEYDSTEFAGRFFIGETDLDDFAAKNGMTEKCHKTCYCRQDIERVCNCQIIYDYEGANPNRQFGDSEIIFNEKEE